MESTLSDLPTELLRNICRCLQTDAVSRKALRDSRDPPPRPTQEPTPPASIPAFIALRSCCKALCSASDSIRTSIRYHIDDFEEIEPYLEKLPSLHTVALDGNDNDDVISDDLFSLQETVPGLQSLTIRNGGPESYTGYDEMWHSNLAGIEIDCLLLWHQTLRHLELHKVSLIKDEDDQVQSTYNLPDGYHEDLGFLAKFPVLASLRLENVLPCLQSSDLVGCTALEHLHIKMLPTTVYQDCMRLDLSACTLLRELDCKASELCSLNVSGCARLEVINVYKNYLRKLDLTGNTSLRRLSCCSNRLRKVLLTGCTALEHADLGDNEDLSTLKVEGCSNLVELWVFGTAVEKLDLSGFSSLTDLECMDSAIENLNLSGCVAVETLGLHNSCLDLLNLTGMTGLKQLTCSDCTLTSLTLSGCIALSILDLRSTSALTSLNLSDCPLLEQLLLQGSGLANLDLTCCPLLQKQESKKKRRKGSAAASKPSRSANKT